MRFVVLAYPIMKPFLSKLMILSGVKWYFSTASQNLHTN
jgi:hypothetical protein